MRPTARQHIEVQLRQAKTPRDDFPALQDALQPAGAGVLDDYTETPDTQAARGSNSTTVLTCVFEHVTQLGGWKH